MAAEILAALGQPWPCPRTVLIVEDALREAELAQHPRVVAPGGIRFFAAAPIFGQPGIPAGVLCLTDTVARAVDQDRRRRLDDLATIASARLRAQFQKRALEEQVTLYRTLVENSADTLVRGGLDGIRQYVSPSLRSLLGFGPEELVGTRASGFVHPDDLPEFTAMMRGLMDGSIGSFTTEHRHQHKDGSWVWLEAFVQATRDPVTGEQDGYVTSVRGTARRKELETRLVHSASHDPLTELPNRALLYERLDLLLANATEFALFCLDLDGFKQVNDRFGHGAGDAVLQDVAHRLRSCVDSGDTVARRGGDEFVAIQVCSATQPEAAITLAQRMIREVAAPMDLDGVPINIGLSVGIAFVPGAGTDVDGVLRAADAALYRAKQAGRNGYRIFGRE